MLAKLVAGNSVRLANQNLLRTMLIAKDASLCHEPRSVAQGKAIRLCQLSLGVAISGQRRTHHCEFDSIMRPVQRAQLRQDTIHATMIVASFRNAGRVNGDKHNLGIKPPNCTHAVGHAPFTSRIERLFDTWLAGAEHTLTNQLYVLSVLINA